MKSYFIEHDLFWGNPKNRSLVENEDEELASEATLLLHQGMGLAKDAENFERVIKHCTKVLRNMRVVKKELETSHDYSYLKRLRVHHGILNDCFHQIEMARLLQRVPLDN